MPSPGPGPKRPRANDRGVSGGTYMIEQGEPADALYVILNGTADALLEHPDRQVIHLRRIPSHARAALAGTSIPVGKILASLGVQRVDRRALCRHGCLDTVGGDVAVESSAVLALDGVKVAIATERITGDFCRLIASSPRHNPDHVITGDHDDVP